MANIMGFPPAFYGELTEKEKNGVLEDVIVISSLLTHTPPLHMANVSLLLLHMALNAMDGDMREKATKVVECVVGSDTAYQSWMDTQKKEDVSGS